MSEESDPRGKDAREGIITCDACPVLCRIRPGRLGACDRYGNVEGVLTRMDPMVVASRTAEKQGPWCRSSAPANGKATCCPRARPSSPASAPEPPIPTTSPHPSSLRAGMPASTW